MSDEHVAVAIVGGGPAGLTAAAELAGRVAGEVVVIEREARAGGIPRHSDHPGYGIRDRRRFMSGPAYARLLVAEAERAGARIDTSTMVTGWCGDRALALTSPTGRTVMECDAIVLATGARERPRPARLISGDRPDGVYTTGQLQNMVHLHHQRVGRTAVVVGAELVSWSAVLTLRDAGCRTALMTTTYEKSESYLAFRMAGKTALRVPVAPRTRLVRVNGKGRVESVELENLDSGERRVVACDTVITTGDWIPDHELARSGDLAMDRATRGPEVDAALRTSRPGVFAIGNLLHPVDTADVAALDGRHVAANVCAWLRSGSTSPAPRGPRLVADAPLRWVAPQILDLAAGPPARNRLLAWSDAFVTIPRVSAMQDGRLLARRVLPWPAAPGRVFGIPGSLVAKADPAGGDVHLRLH